MGDYLKRGEFKPILANAIKKNGRWWSILNYIINSSSDFDVQVRANYLNIYYAGGNILRINPKSLFVDEFYFHTDIDEKDRNTRKSVIVDKAKHGNKRAQGIIEELKKKRDGVKAVIEVGNASDEAVRFYFDTMKEQMEKWERVLFDKLVKDEEKQILPSGDYAEKCIFHKEKAVQHKISLSNRSFADSELVVIDLEYAVSDLAEYADDNENSEERIKHPRFDIIAIDKNGRFHVLELKYGLGATGIYNPGENDSDISGHVKKFEITVGGEKHNEFIDDVKSIVSRKSEMELLDLQGVEVSEEQPLFDLVYADPGNVNVGVVKEFVESNINRTKKRIANIWSINTLEGYKLNKIV